MTERQPMYVGTVLRSTAAADVKADRRQRRVVMSVADDFVMAATWQPNGHYLPEQKLARRKDGKVSRHEVVHHPRAAFA